MSAALLLLLTSAEGVRAEGEWDFPSLQPGFSLDSARSAVLAYQREWKEDDAAMGSELYWTCFTAGIDAVAKPILLPSVSILLEIDSYLMRKGRDGKLIPGRVLEQPISQLIQSVELTREERSRAENLKERITQNLTDRLKLAADSQWYLMTVSDRIYGELYQEHQSRTEGWVGKLRYFEERCLALQIRRERNTRLSQAASRILALYAFMERESRKEGTPDFPLF